MNDGSIKRILVALDASKANSSALLAAVELASQLHAELQALFVEDINLLRLAELPFAREMVFGSYQGRRITSDNMQRQLQQQVTRLRGAVDTIAQQRQIQVEFKVLRGSISNELCQAAQQMDLIIMGKNTQLQRSMKLGRVTQDVLSTVSCNILLLQYGAIIERPIGVLFDGSEASHRALQLAIQLAHNDHDHLKVIYPAVTAAKQQELQNQARNLTQGLGIDAGQILLPRNTSDALLQASLQCNCRLVIVEATSDDFPHGSMLELIRDSLIPVIVMR